MANRITWALRQFLKDTAIMFGAVVAMVAIGMAALSPLWLPVTVLLWLIDAGVSSFIALPAFIATFLACLFPWWIMEQKENAPTIQPEGK